MDWCMPCRTSVEGLWLNKNLRSPHQRDHVNIGSVCVFNTADPINSSLNLLVTEMSCISKA